MGSIQTFDLIIPLLSSLTSTLRQPWDSMLKILSKGRIGDVLFIVEQDRILVRISMLEMGTMGPPETLISGA